MTEVSRRVAATCPSCSPGAETAHEVLSEGGQATVRCVDCGHVHKTTLESPSVTVDVVVSQGGESFPAEGEFDSGEVLAEGDEFVLESETGVFMVRVTSLSVGTERRAESAPVEDVETVWTRDVGNVAVATTVHPPEGVDAESRGIDLHVPGDFTFTVGESETLGEETFTVEGIYPRDGADEYPDRKLDRPGRTVPAKDVKRLYVRDEDSSLDAWSAW